MSKSTQSDPEGVPVTYRRNGSAKQSGDARFTLDADAEGIEQFGSGKATRPVVAIPLGDGAIIRQPLPANVYVPKGQDVSSVEGFTLRVGLDSVQHADAKTPKGSAAANGEAIAVMLAKGGQREALIELLCRTMDGVGPKSAPAIADGMIAAQEA